MSYEKPIPLKNEDNAPFWDAADRHELFLQKCHTCQQFAHPPGPACAKCGSSDLTWENLGTDIKGRVYSYVISHRPFLPGFQNDTPLVIAVIELVTYPEVKMIGNILNHAIEDIHIGMEVEMTWQKINDGRSLPQWE
ncbi:MULTISPECIES: Zn-ribbon domain-containing OB-fold protein [Cytobacillus]|uniref:Zn-ribbon domain-containing OB-fold protein n=1 Tax=Cytobacillus TaxID=2675230 RepID=UPI00203FC188|nr:OB-fold domain-containing protein [Cytobacillus kochii]MCM3322870.1 OB-fold domain-containing protein [Cytobacillus kochii]MCM3344651.1 OB-fold domain-containing protein [Cytobacillus kochii]MDM5209181.1 OB-fold domain-containing protein [Cytobacillus kochii]